MPETWHQLIAFYQERDILLLGIGLCLGVIAWFIATRLIEYEDFFKDHQPAARDFDQWRQKRATAHLCPQHKMWAVPSCPICGWRPK
jgi:hypothetical protein